MPGRARCASIVVSCQLVGAAQDDLADRQRSARQRRRLGLQDLRARHALLPLHLGEPDRLPERAGARGGQARTSTTPASATPRPSSAGEETVAEKGFYILPSELFANVRERAATDENLNETLAAGLHATSRARRSAPTARTTSRACSTTSTSTASKLGHTVAKRNEKLVKLLDAIGDLDLGDFADNTIDAFGDAYEYLMHDVRLRRPASPAASTTRRRRSPSCSPGSPWSARPR